MRRPPFKAKRDANEGGIFDVLVAFGMSIARIDTPGDALAGYGGRTYLIEVKTEKGYLTEAQKQFLKTWKGDHVILRSQKEAVEWARKVRRGES